MHPDPAVQTHTQVAEEVIARLHDECRALRERHFEREVLLPLLRSVIGIADRCRRENLRLKQIVKGYRRRSMEDVIAISLHQLIEARNADLIEIEAVLAQFDIEAFHNPTKRFDAQTQKAVQLIDTAQPELHQHIAVRLLPGYRRGTTLVRREYVTVYVHNQQNGQEESQ